MLFKQLWHILFYFPNILRHQEHSKLLVSYVHHQWFQPNIAGNTFEESKLQGLYWTHLLCRQRIKAPPLLVLWPCFMLSPILLLHCINEAWSQYQKIAQYERTENLDQWNCQTTKFCKKSTINRVSDPLKLVCWWVVLKRRYDYLLEFDWEAKLQNVIKDPYVITLN